MKHSFNFTPLQPASVALLIGHVMVVDVVDAALQGWQAVELHGLLCYPGPALSRAVHTAL